MCLARAGQVRGRTIWPGDGGRSAVRRGLDVDPAGFALTARQAALARAGITAADPERSAEPRSRLLLVVDQFEQLFTQCDDEEQRRALITALHAASTVKHGPDHEPAALVVLGVRADFEARCADYPLLAGAIQDRYLVTAMTERQLRLAITEPAKKAGSSVEDDLTDELLREVRTRHPGAFSAGVLPLLSHALDQAWRTRTGDSLTLADYERTGGIEGAVADSAQRAYDSLTPAQQAAARQVFTRLTACSDGADTSDRPARTDLTAGKGAAEAGDVEAVLEAFAAERLLILAAGTVEISHEILPRAWPLLRDVWQCGPGLKQGLQTRQHGGPALRDGLQDAAPGEKPSWVTVSFTTPRPASSMSKVTFERGFARQTRAVASSMPTSTAHSGVNECQADVADPAFSSVTSGAY
jgi:hypothetical protein